MSKELSDFRAFVVSVLERSKECWDGNPDGADNILVDLHIEAADLLAKYKKEEKDNEG